MIDAYICDFVRTPIGRFGGSLSTIRVDDLAAIPLAALAQRHTQIDLEQVDEICLGCANQAGEDNRNVARMALLLADYPARISASTVNRLCGSGMDAIASVTRQIMCGEADLVIAGGVESMSRAPFVMPKAETAFSRHNKIYDTTIGWRFVNPVLKAKYGVDSMPETAENVAEVFHIDRTDQDLFALASQDKAERAHQRGVFREEIVEVNVPQRKGGLITVERDEHPRQTTLDKLSTLPTPFREQGTVTAGNASGVNDGAAAMIIASAKAVKSHDLSPIARVTGFASAGCEPRLMGIGPVSAVKKLIARKRVTCDDFSVIELNEAFASQSLAVLRQLGIADDDKRVNSNGGAIALGHPLGMSGVRIAGTAALELQRSQGRMALASMCVGVGQGVAMSMEAV